jgi:hypothetical protein
MDLQLYFRVLWRFRLIIVAGLLLAIVLATISLVKVTWADGSVKLTYRSPVYYQSQATIFVTQRGYPWGRSVFPSQPTTGRQGASTATSNYADPGRLAYLASVYAQLGTSDAVRAVMRKDGPVRGKIDATPGFDERNGSYQPYVYVSAIATEGALAVELANRAATAIRTVVRTQQLNAGIPANQQVALDLFSGARPPTVVAPRKKTLPIVMFLTVVLITVGLAFVLENIRPRALRIERVPDEKPAAGGAGDGSDWPVSPRPEDDRPAASTGYRI